MAAGHIDLPGAQNLPSQTWTQDAVTVDGQQILICDSSGNIVGVTSNRLDVNVGAALPAGTNNIGDVDVLTVPADPFGANADAVVAAGASGSQSAKLRRLTTDIDAIKTSVAAATPAGTNNIGDVDVLTVPADPFGANADAVVAAGATGSVQAKLRRLTTDIDAIKTSVAGATPAGTATIGTVGLAPQTAGGLTVWRLLSAATTNATSVKASAGQVFGWFLFNANASTRYLKIYNKASAPTVGTDTPVITVPIPGGSAANVEYTNGIAFATGIAFALTTGIADSDTGAVAANDIVTNLMYK